MSKSNKDNGPMIGGEVFVAVAAIIAIAAMSIFGGK